MSVVVVCDTCGLHAEINQGEGTIIVEPNAPVIPDGGAGAPRYVITFKFPSHADCELARPVDEIRLNKLTIATYTFHGQTGAIR